MLGAFDIQEKARAFPQKVPLGIVGELVAREATVLEPATQDAKPGNDVVSTMDSPRQSVVARSLARRTRRLPRPRR